MRSSQLEFNEMRISVGIVFLASVLVLAANAQEGPPLIRQEPVLQHSEDLHVRKIAVVANGLSSSVTKKISTAIEGKTCNSEEIQERVRFGFRDIGYEEVRVDKPQFATSDAAWADTFCDVTVRAFPGAQYRLGYIEFHGNTAIAAEQLRREFGIQTGSLFNATAVGRGLESIKRLYLSKGYINMGAIPKTKTDEARRTIALILDIDEGKAWDFGRLLLQGPEPYAGAGKSLMAAWTLQGARFNPELLTKWIASNAPFLPNQDDVLWRTATPRLNALTQRVDIELQFPWPDPPND
jgi:hypothetical protein